MSLLTFTAAESMALRIAHEKFIGAVEAICRANGVYEPGTLLPGFTGFVFTSDADPKPIASASSTPVVPTPAETINSTTSEKEN